MLLYMQIYTISSILDVYVYCLVCIVETKINILKGIENRGRAESREQRAEEGKKRGREGER